MVLEALIALALLQAGPGQGTLFGRTVTAEGAGFAPLPYATVTALSDQRRYRTATDLEGRFSFDDLPDGSYVLRAIHPGYVPAEIEVVLAGGRSVSVDLVLRVQPLDLDPVVVTVEGAGRRLPRLEGALELSGEEAAAVSLRAMEVGSGMAASGMTGLFEGLPGNDPGDPTDALFMRGSAMDLKVVLLDGAPLYTPFHVSGLIPAFDPALLEAAHLYNGGAPAEFDGGLSHVLDLRTRSARRDAFHARGSADLMSARLGVEAPLGEAAGLAVGARALHAGAERALGRTGFPYGYADAVARLDFRPRDDHELSLTAFRNEESVRLDFRRSVEADRLASAPALPSESSWGNRAVTAGYEADLGRTFVRARAAVSRYQAELPVQGESPLFASGSTDRVRLAFDLGRRSLDARNTRWAAGATLDAVDVSYRASRLIDSGAPGSEIRSSAAGSVAAAFVEGASQVQPNLRLSAGLRAASYDGAGVRLGPRVGVTWLLGDGAAFSVRAGRSHQLTTSSDAAVESALAFEALADTAAQAPSGAQPSVGALVSVASSTHLVVGLDQLLSSRTRLGIEAWARRFEGIDVADLKTLNGSGFDLRIARAGESLDGWLGYSLTWYWSDDLRGDSPFSGRHLLSAGLLGEMGSAGRFNVQLALGDGLPFTAISLSDAATADGEGINRGIESEQRLDSATEVARGGPALTGGPPGDFLRLDGEVSWRITRRWGGRDVEIQPYVRVLNALNRRDAMFYYFEPWRDVSPRPLAELAIVPVVGISWRF